MTNLWPRTPVNSIQTEIWRRCGASDWNLNHPRCRARLIITLLGEMIDNHLLDFDFSVIDLFCGDAVILTQVKRAFPGSKCAGVDVRAYPEHEAARDAGVTLWPVAVQHVIAENMDTRQDVAILLNTWRGWDKADLPPEEADLPERVEKWLIDNARYIVVTAGKDQIEAMKARGWWVWDVGPGEDDSRMVCAFWSGAK